MIALCHLAKRLIKILGIRRKCQKRQTLILRECAPNPMFDAVSDASNKSGMAMAWARLMLPKKRAIIPSVTDDFVTVVKKGPEPNKTNDP